MSTLVCQARIVREFKRRKAETRWPETTYGPVPDAQLPVEPCLGAVTVTLKAVDEPYFGGSSATLEADWVCTRCAMPYVPGRLAFDAKVAAGAVTNDDIEALGR